VEKVVCPPFLFLLIARDRLKGSSVKVGAQNMHWAEKGAYTGEVSHPMLAGVVEYVIVGHSERRAYFCETDETVNKKLAAALAAGLKPIFCVGETESEREAGSTEEVLLRQVRIGLEGIEVPQGFAIAYEPVWAIGTGKAATGPMASEAIGLIRGEVARLAGGAVAESVRILYGGSVTPDNMAEFARQPDADLAQQDLLGAASLALRLRLADAEDGLEAGSQGGGQLLVHCLVGLAEVGPPLRVTDDDVLYDAGQHGMAHLAGVGTLLRPVHVLGAHLHRAALQPVAGDEEEGEGWADHLLHARDAVHPLPDAVAERGTGDSGGVHLPVTGDNGNSHVHAPYLVRRRAWAMARGITSVAGKVPREPAVQASSLNSSVRSGRHHCE